MIQFYRHVETVIILVSHLQVNIKAGGRRSRLHAVESHLFVNIVGIFEYDCLFTYRVHEVGIIDY